MDLEKPKMSLNVDNWCPGPWSESASPEYVTNYRLNPVPREMEASKDEWGHRNNDVTSIQLLKKSCNREHDRPLCRLSFVFLFRWSRIVPSVSHFLSFKFVSRVRFPALPDFLSSSRSGTGFTQFLRINEELFERKVAAPV
jgi:hypothetical protein